jgi:Cu-Zn family superoxide dismutase
MGAGHPAGGDGGRERPVPELGDEVQAKRVLAAALGIGVLGALGLSAGAVAQRGAGSAARVSTQVAVAERVGPGPNSAGQRRDHVQVLIKDVQGRRVGQVDIAALPRGGNQVRIHAWSLAPGFHGIHVHMVGICDPGGPKPFASSGGHFNPTGKPEGMQAGAFPVLLAGADGEAQTQFVDGNFTIPDLLGPSGTAIVIHAAPDNYANVPNRYTANGVAGPDAETQMTGDAGARVACGVVSAPRVTPSGSPS